MTRCESTHQLGDSNYILFCTMQKRHKGKHSFTFVWDKETQHNSKSVEGEQ